MRMKNFAKKNIKSTVLEWEKDDSFCILESISASKSISPSMSSKISEFNEDGE